MKINPHDQTNESSAEQRERRLSSENEGKSGTVKGVYHDDAPPDFHRSDEELRQDIIDALKAHPNVGAETISVSVNNGVAVLEGIVTDGTDNAEVEEIVRRVMDVRDVENRLN